MHCLTRRRFKRLLAATSVLLLLIGAGQPGWSQTVQLPSFQTFSYSGSVLVPTGGSTSLGGVSRSYSQRSRRGLSGRSSVAAFGHSGAAAHVTVIDHDAIDRKLRGLPPRGAVRGATGGNAAVVKAPTAVGPNVAALQDPDAEGKALVRFARKQYLAGRKTSSYDAYQLAIQTLTPELSELARAECKRVFPRVGLAQARFPTR